VLHVVEGREELAGELGAAPVELRRAVASTFRHLLMNPDFTNALPGLIAESERAATVLQRMQVMCG